MKSAFKDNVFIGKKLDIQAQDRMCRRTWKELNLTYIPAGKKKNGTFILDDNMDNLGEIKDRRQEWESRVIINKIIVSQI